MKTSVALCTYNGASFLYEQLQSIFDQSTAVDEVVICDDGSTDETISIIEKFKQRHPGKTNLVQNRSKLGPIKNFEKCIGLTTGDIIFLSDQDDVWYNDKVECYTALFSRDKKALLVFSNGDLINDEGKQLQGDLWQKWNFSVDQQQYWLNNRNAFEHLVKYSNKVTGATVAFTSEMKKYIFPFELPPDYWHDVWLAIVAAGFGGLRMEQSSTIKYRVHQQQQVGVGNGTNISVGDTTDGGQVAKEDFFKRIETMFPKLWKEIFPAEKSVLKPPFAKLRDFFGS